jgi:hypothetical protein
MAAASTVLTAATASTPRRTGGLAAERWRGATSILTENYLVSYALSLVS